MSKKVYIILEEAYIERFIIIYATFLFGKHKYMLNHTNFTQVLLKKIVIHVI